MTELEYLFLHDFFPAYLENFDINECKKSAEEGDAVAQALMAMVYRLGLFNVKENEKKAFSFIKKSAKQNCIEGITFLGEFYEDGVCLEADPEKAFEIYSSVVESNYTLALYDLGNLYLKGLGTEHDEAKGLELLMRAADRECFLAFQYLEDYYPNSGDAFTEDALFKVCKKGAKLNHAYSITMLGRCYKDGCGTPVDEKKAFTTIKKAAKLNEPYGLYWLGWFYATGTVVEKDIDKANEYYDLAVKNGFQEPEENKQKTLEDYYKEQQHIEINVNGENAINYKTAKNKVPDYVMYIDTERGSGSGFVIDPNGYVATCAHVVADFETDTISEKIFVKDKNKKIYKGSVVKISKETDVAIIKMDDAGNLPFAECDFERTESLLGEEIAIYGYPMGNNLSDDVLELNMSITKGYISSNQKKYGLNLTMLDIAARHGNSGGPVISCENGMVIGLLKGSITGNIGQDLDEVNYMLPVSYLYDLINSADEEIETAEETEAVEAESSTKAQKKEKSDRPSKSSKKEMSEKTEAKGKDSDEYKLSTKPFKTWAEVKRFLRKHYVVDREDNDWLVFKFTFEDSDRSQEVVVTLANDKWLNVISTIGLIDDTEINKVLEDLCDFNYGGLIKLDDKHCIRYAVPISGVSEESLIIPIETIASIADKYEEEFIGGDQN